MDAAHFFRDQWRPFSRLFQLSLFVNTLTLKFFRDQWRPLIVSFNYHYSWTPWHSSFFRDQWRPFSRLFNCHYSWTPWNSSFLQINDDLLVVSCNCHYSWTPWHSSFFRDQWRPFSRLFQLSLFVNTLTFKFASLSAARCNTCLTSIVFSLYIRCELEKLQWKLMSGWKLRKMFLVHDL